MSAPHRLAAVANVRLPTEKAHGVQIMAMCAAFAAAGAAVTLVVPCRWRNPLAGDPFAFFGAPRTFTMRRVATLDLLPLQRLLGPLAFWSERLSFLISAFVATRRHDACWTRDELFAAAWSLLRRAPLVLEVHAPSRRVAWTYRYAARRGRIVAITNGVREALVGLGVSPDRIVVLHDAVDAERFHPMDRDAARRTLGLASEKRYVVYAGHLYVWKGAHVLAEASALLPAEVETLIVGGTETDLVAFRRYLAERGLSRTRLVGWRPASEIPQWVAAADAIVIPTSGKEPIGRAFTSPLKLFEAMASCRPIVASDLPSTRESLTDGETALLVRPDDAAALASGIGRVLEDRAFADRIAEAAFVASKSRTWHARAKAVLALLQA